MPRLRRSAPRSLRSRHAPGVTASPGRLGAPLAGVLATLAVLAAPPGVPAQPAAYSGAEIRARVVDKETKQPLQGVFVIAESSLDALMSPGKTPLQLMEAVTDAKGEFYFPPWGPKERPTFSQLWGGDPRLWLFKPGYEPDGVGNPTVPDDRPVRVSHWHAKTIELTPFRGTPEQWAAYLGSMRTTLRWGWPTNEFPRRINDYWKHYPRTVLAVLEEIRRLPEPYRVVDLDEWQVSEEQLREAARGKERTP